MKLTIERAALLRALAHVQGVVERRNTIPILSNVRMEAKDSRLRLTATDMDLAIVESVPADVGQEDATTIPAHTLYDIVRKLPEGAQIEIDDAAEDGRVVVRAGRSRFILGSLPVEDFPVMAEGDLPYGFSLDAASLRRLIDKTRFAVSTEETRYYLNGIYFHVVADGARALRAVATDGHRLARVDIVLPDGAGEMPGIIVPRKAVAELRKLIEEVDGDVDVQLSDSKIRFAFGDVVLTSKLIDGTFPDYERVVPADNDKTMTVVTKSLLDAVDRVSTISTEKSRAIKLIVESGKLTLTATSPEAGSATEEIDADYAGEQIEIGFNSRYVLDMTAQIEGDSVELVMADGTSPTLVRDTGDEGALYVIMPMRV